MEWLPRNFKLAKSFFFRKTGKGLASRRFINYPAEFGSPQERISRRDPESSGCLSDITFPVKVRKIRDSAAHQRTSRLLALRRLSPSLVMRKVTEFL